MHQALWGAKLQCPGTSYSAMGDVNLFANCMLQHLFGSTCMVNCEKHGMILAFAEHGVLWYNNWPENFTGPIIWRAGPTWWSSWFRLQDKHEDLHNLWKCKKTIAYFWTRWNVKSGHAMDAEMILTLREVTISANQAQTDASKASNMLPNWLPLGGLVRCKWDMQICQSLNKSNMCNVACIYTTQENARTCVISKH